MKKTFKGKTSILLLALFTAAVLTFTACANSKAESENSSSADASVSSSDNNNDITVLGEGETVFTFSVTDVDGNETLFEIHTDKTTVGDALTDVELISGDESEYGLYVKTVNGITLDYDTDGKYWAFYINGEYASTGVDSTNITAGDSYSFKAE